MRTIIIAGDCRAAEDVMRFHALQASDVQMVPSGSIWISAGLAATSGLRGRRPDRIIIAGNYLRWHLQPGLLTDLWQTVRMMQARGAEVIFS